MLKRRINSILKEVRQYYSFLFQLGYDIQNVGYYPHEFGNWEVRFESNRCILEICKDRTEILIYFLPLNGDRHYRISLKAMIYYLSQRKIFVGPFKGNLFWGMKRQYEESASLLKIYHDQITPYFGSKFDLCRNELLHVERDYFMFVVQNMEKSKRGR